MSPFGLTPGFEGPAQPSGQAAEEDPDVGPVAPFMMAVINTKNVHRSNLLMGHPYGRDFVYDEMVMGAPGAGGPGFTDLGSLPGGGRSRARGRARRSVRPASMMSCSWASQKMAARCAWP